MRALIHPGRRQDELGIQMDDDELKAMLEKGKNSRARTQNSEHDSTLCTTESADVLKKRFQADADDVASSTLLRTEHFAEAGADADDRLNMDAFYNVMRADADG